MNEEFVKISNIRILRRWWEIKSAKANILFVHGLGEHSGRYEEMARKMNAIGFSFYTYDRAGEGASDGRRTYIHNIDDHVNDLKHMINLLSKDGGPVILMAHSLGGLIAVKYLIDHRSENVISFVVSGALLETDPDMAPFLKKIAGIVGRIFPLLPTVKLDSSLVSRTKEEVKKYDADPLIYHGATSARTGMVILNAIKYVQAHLRNINLPILITHGGADKLTNPSGSQMLYDHCTSTDKTIKIFDGWYHEIMREPEKEQFYELVTEWLLERY